MATTVYVGDNIEVLKTFPDNHFQMVVTSPPYWGLRNYGMDGQLGLEPTPELYVGHLVEVFREVRRVLREDGCVFLNLGDSYAGSGKGQMGNGEHAAKHGEKQHTSKGTLSGGLPTDYGGLKPKDLVGIPWMVAFALRDDGWYLRSDIIWGKGLSFCEKEIKCPHCGGKHKFNYAGSAMPESVRDRPTKGHEYMFLLSKSARYYWDQDAVREPIQSSSVERVQYGWHGTMVYDENGRETYRSQPDQTDQMGERWAPPNGRNLRSVWAINPGNFQMEMCGTCKHVYTKKEYKRLEKDGKKRVCKCGESNAWLSHFATFPPALVEPCIKAGTSERGCCPECGAAWERCVEKVGELQTRWASTNTLADVVGGTHRERTHQAVMATIGWRPTCEHYPGADQWLEYEPNRDNDPEIAKRNEAIRAIRTLLMEKFEQYENLVPCRVLDPFWGIGTTSLVSERLGRDSVGIELNPDYAIMGKAYIEGECPLLTKVEVVNGTQEI